MSQVYPGQAAVLITLRETRPTGEEEVLLTLRSEHLSTHAGEVAFPGGMWETQDADLYRTALREAHEEVGLPPNAVAMEAQLAAGHTRSGVRVTPYAVRITDSVSLTPNPAELQALFWLPLSLIKQDLRVRTDIFAINGAESWAPVYEYAGYTIWGLTAKLLIAFVNQRYGLSIERKHNDAPEIIYDVKGRA